MPESDFQHILEHKLKLVSGFNFAPINLSCQTKGSQETAVSIKVVRIGNLNDPKGTGGAVIVDFAVKTIDSGAERISGSRKRNDFSVALELELFGGLVDKISKGLGNGDIHM